jgi:hypothetical protein
MMAARKEAGLDIPAQRCLEVDELELQMNSRLSDF